MARAAIKGMTALILAVVLLWPGALWSQRQKPMGRLGSSPRQADKPSFQNPKKKKKQVREKRKKSKSLKKGRSTGKKTATKTKTTKRTSKKARVSPLRK